ncbi:hypothetical protein PR003_g10347 [Phytophthora rubi]|uniref:RxLR effector protein n=1 Tax=Phytophthora rubi TaxID=129364 RepID=A0A6A3MS00_9STRA|nr:hypothetical protein PR002_g9893 [Phytophthora rubi]KAE9033797.1 hypothetical protein PR001_g10006 [Phytophthora rubi]KAE9340706.1 hypothetical protein PR003_g10347 [Phytophthora rubi]
MRVLWVVIAVALCNAQAAPPSSLRALRPEVENESANATVHLERLLGGDDDDDNRHGDDDDDDDC